MKKVFVTTALATALIAPLATPAAAAPVGTNRTFSEFCQMFHLINDTNIVLTQETSTVARVKEPSFQLYKANNGSNIIPAGSGSYGFQALRRSDGAELYYHTARIGRSTDGVMKVVVPLTKIVRTAGNYQFKMRVTWADKGKVSVTCTNVINANSVL